MSAERRQLTAAFAAASGVRRSWLTAAKAAVSCMRSADIQLTAADQDELLATAEESLDLLTNLVASLLDVSRLQAGALPVFPRPADLQEIIVRSLGGIGPQAEAVMVDVPRDLPQAMVVTVSRSPASRRSRACYPPCWPVAECHSDTPGPAARAAGSDAGALQTWFHPPGRPKPGVSRGTD